jgi:predicted methyltransferase
VRRLFAAAALACTLGVQAAAFQAATIEDAVLDPARSDADVVRDGRDRAQELLAFFGVREGQAVLDLFAGGGYWSELIGRVVAPGGQVYMHNNAVYLGFAGKALDERIARGTLGANVQRLDAEMGALPIPPASLDLVFMFMTYHDIYYRTDEWTLDPAAVFAELRALLKPGGVLAIVDHAAAPGSDQSTAQTLHRIDEAFARKDIESRGFRFDGALDVLRVPADDHTLQVFDPAIRGRTDRFVHRYVRTAD